MAPIPAAGQGQTAVKAKRFVLGALTATLAVAAVVTVSFVILRPARVHLSVTRAQIINKSKQVTAGVVELALTLAGNNTSKRAEIVYESMFLDVTNSSTGAGELGSSFISANLTTAMPVRQRRGEVAGFSATLLLVPGVWTDASGNWTTRNRFAVVVTAMARFKVGVARTRLFDIKLACRPVSFVPAANGDAAKLNGGAQDGRLPVDNVDCA
ncbi:unnamed protein product [Urochloa decumbens]|uniref:Late embryogenesis abundant protein LEA-2 subgroup domain-containing protein n=1 Tax=Urochloa decumbens TaxID=240449 RepID=A0ABC9E450_9POAL